MQTVDKLVNYGKYWLRLWAALKKKIVSMIFIIQYSNL